MNVQSTQADILRALAPLTSTYLEVGVQEGKSFVIVCKANPALTFVTLCDTWGRKSGGTGRGSHDHIPLPPLTKVHFLDGDSCELLPLISGPTFGLVHIDGGHSYEVALSDLMNGWRLCHDTMVVHDITFTEVWQAFCEFAKTLEEDTNVEVYFGGHGTAVVRRR